MFWTTRLISLLALSASMTLSEGKELNVWRPRITYPNKYTQWTATEYHHVFWDASNPPESITNPIGKIYLVVDNLIKLDKPLASDFSLLDGVVGFSVPNVPTGQYQVVLMGDSGDTSDLFNITGK